MLFCRLKDALSQNGCFAFVVIAVSMRFFLCIILHFTQLALSLLVFMGDTEVFPAMMNSTFSSAKTAFEISLGLTGVLSLWLGIMKIGERGGVVNALARVLSPVFAIRPQVRYS